MPEMELQEGVGVGAGGIDVVTPSGASFDVITDEGIVFSRDRDVPAPLTSRSKRRRASLGAGEPAPLRALQSKKFEDGTHVERVAHTITKMATTDRVVT
jgi:hypothetical protein